MFHLDFKLKFTNFEFDLQARNGEQKREWCLQLKRVILENYNAVIPSHARQLVMELGQSKQEGNFFYLYYYTCIYLMIKQIS